MNSFIKEFCQQTILLLFYQELRAKSIEFKLQLTNKSTTLQLSIFQLVYQLLPIAMQPQNLTELTPQVWYKRQQIGNGGFGVVYQGINIILEIFVAVKKIILSFTKAEIYTKREVEILQSIEHKNIIRYYDSFHKPQSNECYLILQYCDGGDLYQAIQKQKQQGKKLSQEVCLRYLQQIINGVQYLHKKQIIHRDLKTKNILLTKDKTIKLCDFGIAKNIEKQIDRKNMTQNIGTLHNKAPEVSTSEYSFECDIWSLGIILYQMCTGSNPFVNLSMMEFYQKLKSIEQKKYLRLEGDYNPFFKEIIKRTIVYKPESRIGIKQLKQKVDGYINNKKLQKQTKEKKQGVVSCDIPQPKKLNKIRIVQVITKNKDSPKNQQKKNNSLSNGQNLEMIQQMQLDLTIKQEHTNSMNSLQSCIFFLNQRSRVFVHFADLNYRAQKQNNQNIGKKRKTQNYLGLAIAIAIYYQNLEYLGNILRKEIIEFGESQKIEASKLHCSVKEVFEIKRQTYLKNIQKQKNVFLQVLPKFKQKLQETQHKKIIDTKFYQFQIIVSQLNKGVQGRFTYRRQIYQKLFRRFYLSAFRFQQAELQSMSEQRLRIVLALIKLTDVDAYLPISQYQNINIIPRFKQQIQKAKKKDMIKEINQALNSYINSHKNQQKQFSKLIQHSLYINKN